MLSPPSSPRDHRHYIPRRPSPLSLPANAPHLPMAASSSVYQPFSLTELAVETPKTGARMPRYPLEKQRRALKELEQDHQQKRLSQQMQSQQPMSLPRGQAPVQDMPSPTTTLPLTPRSSASSVSAYSQHEEEALKRKGRSVPTSMCATLFGSCFAAFAISSKRLETVNVRTIASAR